MNIEEIREYCLQKKGTTESFPFDEVTLVFKVMGKMFALLPLDETDGRLNLKCDPQRAMALREKHSGVIPGYHMSKKHWNTLVFNGSFTDVELREWIDQSYDLVVASLTKKLKNELNNLT